MPNLEEVRGIDWKVSTLQKQHWLMSMIDIFEMWKWQRKWFSFMSTTQLCVSIVVFGPKVRQSDNCNMILNKRFDQPVLRHCIALFYKKKMSENHTLVFESIGFDLFQYNQVILPPLIWNHLAGENSQKYPSNEIWISLTEFNFFSWI